MICVHLYYYKALTFALMKISQSTFNSVALAVTYIQLLKVV
jgi:hypothetical protein